MVSYCYILPNVGGLVKIDGNKSSVRFQSTKYLIGSGYVILKKNHKKYRVYEKEWFDFNVLFTAIQW